MEKCGSHAKTFLYHSHIRKIIFQFHHLVSCIRKKIILENVNIYFTLTHEKKDILTNFGFLVHTLFFTHEKQNFSEIVFTLSQKKEINSPEKFISPFKMFFFSSHFHKWKKKSQILFYFLIKFHVKKNILQNSFFFFFFCLSSHKK